MTITAVNAGAAANDGTGDPLRTAFQTINANFTTNLPATAYTWTATQTFARADSAPPITIQSTLASASTPSPIYETYRNRAAPANGDKIGAVDFYGNDASVASKLFGRLEARCPDVTAGSEDGDFALQATINGTLTDVLVVGSSGFTTTLPATVGNATAGGHAVNRTTGDARYAQLAAANTFSATGATSLAQTYQAEGAISVTVRKTSSDNAAPSVQLAKQRGTIASPAAVASGDLVARYQGAAQSGSGIVAIFELRSSMTEVTPSASAMGSRITAFCTPVGSVTLTEILRAEHETGLSLFASAVIDQNRLICLRSLTLGTLATAAAGKVQYASDLGGGAGPLYHDGTRNKRFSDGGYAAIATDADATLTVLSSATYIRHTGSLTADRAVTLSTTGAYAGARFKITRTGAGAFNLNVGSGPLKALATNTWGEFVYDGSAWYLAAYGAL